MRSSCMSSNGWWSSSRRLFKIFLPNPILHRCYRRQFNRSTAVFRWKGFLFDDEARPWFQVNQSHYAEADQFHWRNPVGKEIPRPFLDRELQRPAGMPYWTGLASGLTDWWKHDYLWTYWDTRRFVQVNNYRQAMGEEISNIPGCCDVRPEIIGSWIKDPNPNRRSGRRPKK